MLSTCAGPKNILLYANVEFQILSLELASLAYTECVYMYYHRFMFQQLLIVIIKVVTCFTQVVDFKH